MCPCTFDDLRQTNIQAGQWPGRPRIEITSYNWIFDQPRRTVVHQSALYCVYCVLCSVGHYITGWPARLQTRSQSPRWAGVHLIGGRIIKESQGEDLTLPYKEKKWLPILIGCEGFPVQPYMSHPDWVEYKPKCHNAWHDALLVNIKVNINGSKFKQFQSYYFTHRLFNSLTNAIMSVCKAY